MWGGCARIICATMALAPGTRLGPYETLALLGAGIRPLARGLNDAGEGRILPGTEDGSFPFSSPDSRSIGFFAGGKLKRIDIEGGLVQVPNLARRHPEWLLARHKLHRNLRHHRLQPLRAVPHP